MHEKSEIRCVTPSCVDAVAKYGERYHGVLTGLSNSPELYPGFVASCERCGGHTDGEHWWFRCRTCKAELKPGELVGLFVPYHCQGCQRELIRAQEAAGHVCSMCRKAFSMCCC